MYVLKKLFIIIYIIYIIYISNLSERFNKVIFSVFKIHIKKLRNNWNVHTYELIIMRNENNSKFRIISQAHVINKIYYQIIDLYNNYLLLSNQSNARLTKISRGVTYALYLVFCIIYIITIFYTVTNIMLLINFVYYAWPIIRNLELFSLCIITNLFMTNVSIVS